MDYANKHRKETGKIKGQKWRECKPKKSSIPQYPFKCLADSQIYTQYTTAIQMHSHKIDVLIKSLYEEKPQKMEQDIRHCRKYIFNIRSLERKAQRIKL